MIELYNGLSVGNVVKWIEDRKRCHPSSVESTRDQVWAEGNYELNFGHRKFEIPKKFSDIIKSFAPKTMLVFLLEEL